MFGYIVVNKPELKIKDFALYKSFYCGLCRELKRKYGVFGQLSLTYDMTFVALLLSGLYEPETKKGTTHCILHPVHKEIVRKNRFTEYAADMNIILTYYKCVDDWKDDRDLLKLAYAKALKGKNRRLSVEYDKKVHRIIQLLEQLSDLEKKDEKDIDQVSGIFGKIMAEIFVYQEDVWANTLRKMGFYFGKFIYILDAYDDVEADLKNGNYNPFLKRFKIKGFEDEVQQLLIMMLAEACREFEKLPIIIYGDILRNILYSGVWVRFEAITRKRREEQEKEHV